MILLSMHDDDATARSIAINFVVLFLLTVFGVLAGFGYRTVAEEPLRVIYAAIVPGGLTGIYYVAAKRGLIRYVRELP